MVPVGKSAGTLATDELAIDELATDELENELLFELDEDDTEDAAILVEEFDPDPPHACNNMLRLIRKK
jgi:hypothetical protein